MKGRFTIAASFIEEGSKMLDQLFAMMIICDKQKIGGSVKYEADCSSMFDGKDSINFVIGYKDGAFEAFPENEIIPEGYIVLNQQGGIFGKKAVIPPLAKKTPPPPKKVKTPEEIAFEKIRAKYPKKQNDLFKLAKKEGFNTRLHKKRTAKTLVEYLENREKSPEKNPEFEYAGLVSKAILLKINPGKTNLEDLRKTVEGALSKLGAGNGDIRLPDGIIVFKVIQDGKFKFSDKEEFEPTGTFLTVNANSKAEEILLKKYYPMVKSGILELVKEDIADDSPDIKAYEVLVSDMVKNQSGFLDAGAVINENQEFEDSFEDMLKAGWIKEIEEEK